MTFINFLIGFGLLCWSALMLWAGIKIGIAFQKQRL